MGERDGRGVLECGDGREEGGQGDVKMEGEGGREKRLSKGKRKGWRDDGDERGCGEEMMEVREVEKGFRERRKRGRYSRERNGVERLWTGQEGKKERGERGKKERRQKETRGNRE